MKYALVTVLTCVAFFDAAQEQDPKPPLFDLHAADGTTATGTLKQIGDDWSIVLLGELRHRDILWLRNGDRVAGNLTGLNGEVIRLEGENHKEVRIDRARATALALNTDLARAQRSKGTYGRLRLANGGRLSLLSA